MSLPKTLQSTPDGRWKGARPIFYFGWLETLIIKHTAWVWNRYIVHILSVQYSENRINSEQYHELASWFDPTQKRIWEELKRLRT